MIITQVHLVLWRIKVHCKMYSFVTQHNTTDVRECAIGMLTAGISTIAVARVMNDNFSTISHAIPALRPATPTADETLGLHNQRIYAQTVRNHLREVNLHTRHPH
jgi:hypothetical protein